MIVNVNSLIESVSNPNGRFRTLEGIYPVTGEDGMPVMKNTGMSVDFMMTYKGIGYTMKCLKSKALKNKAALKDISVFCGIVDSPHITAYEYKESEMTVYDYDGKVVYIDVIMQKTPEGMPLYGLLKKYSAGGDAIKLMKLTAALSSLSEWMAANDFSHGRISSKNIYVGHDNIPVLANYERSCRQIPDEDVRRIAILCCAIYLTACDTRFYPHLAGGSYVSMVQAISDIAGEGSPEELRELITALKDTGNPGDGTEKICALTARLSKCRPARIESLSGMLDSLNDNRNMPGNASASNGQASGRTKYEFAGEIHDNLVRVFDGCRWKYLDKYGETAIDGEFLNASDFYEGRAIVETLTGYGVIDRTGKFLVKPVFDDMDIDPSGCFITATKDGLSGIFNRNGNPITELIFDQILPSSEGMSPVKKDKKFGFIDKDGNIAVPIIYDDVHQFSGGVATVFLNGRSYVIDKNGENIGEVLSVNR